MFAITNFLTRSSVINCNKPSSFHLFLQAYCLLALWPLFFCSVESLHPTQWMRQKYQVEHLIHHQKTRKWRSLLLEPSKNLPFYLFVQIYTGYLLSSCQNPPSPQQLQLSHPVAANSCVPHVPEVFFLSCSLPTLLFSSRLSSSDIHEEHPSDKLIHYKVLKTNSSVMC